MTEATGACDYSNSVLNTITSNTTNGNRNQNWHKDEPTARARNRTALINENYFHGMGTVKVSGRYPRWTFLINISLQCTQDSVQLLPPDRLTVPMTERDSFTHGLTWFWQSERRGWRERNNNATAILSIQQCYLGLRDLTITSSLILL